ncbi:MAG: hypothetical protein V4722_24120 [Bacteroidota bacterium]
MRPLILITFLIGCLKNVRGQKVENQVELPRLKGNFNCIYKPKYSPAQRKKFYPFKIAATIKLVSFRYHNDNSPFKNDTLLTDSLVEVKSLTKTEVDGLTDILYNNFYKTQPNYGSLTQCFYPRNAILFLDRSGHLKEYVLICFHCDRHEESSDKIYFGNDCTQKMEKLRLFFVSAGIKFGTDRSIDLYPGEKTEADIILPIQK